jgi:sugar phosphate isomerase/epimerase
MLRARNNDQSFLIPSSTAVPRPGRRHDDFAPILQELADHNYKGWLVVEANRPGGRVDTNTPRKATTAWPDWFGRSTTGLRRNA